MGKILQMKSIDISDTQELALRNRKSIILAAYKKRFESLKSQGDPKYKSAASCPVCQSYSAVDSESVGLRLLQGKLQRNCN